MKRYIEEVALSGVKNEPLYLTPEKGLEITKAYLLWLTEKTGKDAAALTIAVGQDPRLSGRLLKVSCFNALVPFGVKCFDCDLSATPAMEALATGKLKAAPYHLQCDGAIMITSSRGEPHINGFKFFDTEGLLRQEDYEKILTYSESKEELERLGEQLFLDNFTMNYGKKFFVTEELDLNEIYGSYLADSIKNRINRADAFEKPLMGMKVAVDASNGTGGFIATKVFAKLGADISNSQYLEPDGNFFNHPPSPEDTGAKQSISLKTITKGCDLGLLFDADLSSFSAFDGRGFQIQPKDGETDFTTWLLSYLR